MGKPNVHMRRGKGVRHKLSTKSPIIGETINGKIRQRNGRKKTTNKGESEEREEYPAPRLVNTSVETSEGNSPNELKGRRGGPSKSSQDA